VCLLGSLVGIAPTIYWGDKVKGWNLFGIKWNGKGDKQLIRTTEYLKKPDVQFPKIYSVTPTKRGNVGYFKYDVDDWFMKYESASDSLKDHARFILENPRYSKAIGVTDPKQFLSELAKAGYATSLNYEKFMHDMVDSVLKRLK